MWISVTVTVALVLTFWWWFIGCWKEIRDLLLQTIIYCSTNFLTASSPNTHTHNHLRTVRILVVFHEHTRQKCGVPFLCIPLCSVGCPFHLFAFVSIDCVEDTHTHKFNWQLTAKQRFSTKATASFWNAKLYTRGVAWQSGYYIRKLNDFHLNTY